MNYRIFGLILTMSVCLSAVGVMMSDSEDSDALTYGSEAAGLTSFNQDALTLFNDSSTIYMAVGGTFNIDPWADEHGYYYHPYESQSSIGLTYNPNNDLFSGTISSVRTVDIEIAEYEPVSGEISSTSTIRVICVESTGTHYTHTLIYNGNGGFGIPDTQTVTDDNETLQMTISSLEPSREEHTFLGWSLSASAKIATYQPGSKISIGSTSETLYAVWSQDPIQVHTFIYDLNGGSDGPENEIIVDRYLSIAMTVSSVIPVCEGYTFIGWSLHDGDETIYVGGNQFAVGNETITFYAVWESNTAGSYTHILRYDPNGGSGGPQALTLITSNQSVDMVISSLVPHYSGYSFIGWSLVAHSVNSGEDADYLPAETITVNAALTLYAVWSPSDDDDDDELSITSSYPTSIYTEGMAYAYELTFSMEGSYTVTVTGVSWLTVDGNVISGTVPEIISGQTSINYVILATSSDGQTITQTVIISVQAEEILDQSDIQSIAIIGCLIVIFLIIGYIAVKRRR